MLESRLLSALIFLPLLGGLAILVLRPREARLPDGGAEQTGSGRSTGPWLAGIVVAALEMALALYAWRSFDTATRRFQFRETADWMPGFGVRYELGIDGLGLLMILLTAFLTLLCVLYSGHVTKRPSEYMAFLLILESATIGVFAALDLVLFYVFWELVLIPMYFLIGIWGHERRIYAAVKFFLFTFVGSILMLVAIVFLIVQTGTSSLSELSSAGSMANQRLMGLDARLLLWTYWAFALAFMIKVPMFPLHTWLPDAHVEAPTAGSVLLAGVLLKMGVYGFLRICMPLFPNEMLASAPIFLALAAIAVVYGAIVAAMQPDMKKLVAYTSVSHMGVVMLGVFSFHQAGLSGAVLQSLNHGVSTGMLFFLVGMLYDRAHTREIAAFGGIRRVVPLFSGFFLIAAFSSAALPLTNGFVGEFLVLQGTYLSGVSGPVYAAVGASGMVLSAVYMLWLYQRVFCGPIVHEINERLAGPSGREKLVLAPLVVMIFWFGCYVAPWARMVEASRLSLFEAGTQTAPSPAASAPQSGPVAPIERG